MNDFRTLIQNRQNLMWALQSAAFEFQSLGRNTLPELVRHRGGIFDADSFAFFSAEASRIWQPVDRSMLDWMGVADGDVEVAAHAILAVKLPPVDRICRGHEPATAIDAIWRLGRLLHRAVHESVIVWQELGIVPDSPVIVARDLFEVVDELPLAFLYKDRLNTEAAILLAASASQSAIYVDPTQEERSTVGSAIVAEKSFNGDCGFLGLRVDKRTKTISRVGHDARPVELFAANEQWRLFEALFEAEGTPLADRIIVKLSDGASKGAIRQTRQNLNASILGLGLTVTGYGIQKWVLADASGNRHIECDGASAEA